MIIDKYKEDRCIQCGFSLSEFEEDIAILKTHIAFLESECKTYKNKSERYLKAIKHIDPCCYCIHPVKTGIYNTPCNFEFNENCEEDYDRLQNY